VAWLATVRDACGGFVRVVRVLRQDVWWSDVVTEVWRTGIELMDVVCLAAVTDVCVSMGAGVWVC